MIEDEEDEGPTFMGWVRYRFGEFRYRLFDWWRYRVLRRTRPVARPSATQTAVDALMREHYSSRELEDLVNRPSLSLASLKKKP